MLFATAGMTLITAAADLIVVFLALEILSLSLYVLTGITGRRSSNEAAMKYFLLGAFSSAFFLYGVAMGVRRHGDDEIAGDRARARRVRPATQALALLAFGFLAIGFGFKVSAVPFHMWTPDVYQGAPTPVTAFMAAATKVAAFFALIRVLDVAFQPLTWDWTPVIWVAAAVARSCVGRVLAIAQTRRQADARVLEHRARRVHPDRADRRRTRTASARRCSTWSRTRVMTLGAFGVVDARARREGRSRRRSTAYAGLARGARSWPALMTLFLLSLAGIPPTVGFIAKVSVFGAAIRAGHWPLALVGVLASVVAAFFYLRVIVLMYMQEPQGSGRGRSARLMPRVGRSRSRRVLTLALGVFPRPDRRDPRDGRRSCRW